MVGGTMGRHARSAASRKIFVNGLTLPTTDGMLKSAFRHCGTVEQATIGRNERGTSRGFGFVVFQDAGAAEMAAREGAVKIDGKLCPVRPYTLDGLGASAGGPGSSDAGGSSSEARREVNEFLIRNEASEKVRAALGSVDPRTALRVIKMLESNHDWSYREPVVLTELQKVAMTRLSKELEQRIANFVQSTCLSDEWQQRLESILLGQRPDEIEYVLDAVDHNFRFSQDLTKKADPAAWVMGIVRSYKRQRTLNDINQFCERFGFDCVAADQLSQLTSECARRLMLSWSPVGRGSQRQIQEEFQVRLHQAVKARSVYQQERAKQELSAVASHAEIIKEWSDSEGDNEEEYEDWGDWEKQAGDDATGGWWDKKKASSGPRDEAAGKENSSPYAMDADWDRDADADGKERVPKLGKDQDGVERFIMHSETRGSSDTATRLSASRRKRRQPKPTHFILCVDTSGSMLNKDCRGSNGWLVTRLEAVMDTCHQFITESAMNNEDRYSFLSFNEESSLHFSCERAFDAAARVESLRPVAQKQTLYSMGIRGIEAAIRRDASKLPAHIIFLSDGEPTDPKEYLKVLQVLRRKHAGDGIKVYTIGFGESGKVNASEGDFTYLQQLASLGNGHFQRCGASLESLAGAFTAVTTTITNSRSSRRSTSERHNDHGSRGKEPQESVGRDELGIATICEEDGEQDSEVSEDEVLLEDDDEKTQLHPSNAAPTRRIDFELPVPAVIFQNVDDAYLWESFQAAQTTFEFNGNYFEKSVTLQRVHLRKKPFMQGGMRLVYGMLEDSPKEQQHMCAKRLFQDLQKGDTGFQSHSAFCRSTAVAKYYARIFRSLLKKKYMPLDFGFLSCSLYSPVKSDEQGFHFCGERYLKGHFVKLNSNAGFVNEHEYSDHSAIAQAFSHYSFDRSGGSMMVVDLQGICVGEGRNMQFFLTDPQVHSRGTLERFGAGDLGNQGIRAFFQKHRCGDLCKKLGLKKERDLCDPTHKVKMPGVLNCIKWLLAGHGKGGGGDDGKSFFRNLRDNCRVSTVVVPHEVSSDWLDINMWATMKGGSKATEMLERRLEQYYERNRAKEVVPVRPAGWTTARWEEQLTKWTDASGATVIAWPPNWRDEASGGVKEIWVFADDRAGKGYARAYACKQIKELLQHLPREVDEPAEAEAGASSSTAAAAAAAATDRTEAGCPGEGEEAASASTPQSWKQFQDHSGNKYWHREPDGKWFYERDTRWQRFLDDGTQKHWWYNLEGGLWFFEP